MIPEVTWEGYIDGTYTRIWQIGPDAFIYSFATPPRDAGSDPMVIQETVYEGVKLADGEKQLIVYEIELPSEASGEWINPSNAIELDDQYASHVVSLERSGELIVSGFHLDLPPDVEVQDIVVTVHRRLI